MHVLLCNATAKPHSEYHFLFRAIALTSEKSREAILASTAVGYTYTILGGGGACSPRKFGILDRLLRAILRPSGDM